MLQNYFKIAWRSLLRSTVFSLINILGLSIGISASLVIYLIVQYDLSFDNFHQDKEKIFRVTSEFKGKDASFYNSGVCIPLKEALSANATGVENIACFYEAYIGKATGTDSTSSEFKNPKNIIFANPHYLQLFKYEWLAGNAGNALRSPNTVILTESRANAYFSNRNYSQLLGRRIVYDDTLTVTVTGIVKDFVKNTDFTFKEFISLKTIEANTYLRSTLAWTEWNNTNSAFQLFVKLKKEDDAVKVDKQLQLIAALHQDKEELLLGQKRIFRLQPLSDIHFNQNYGNFDQRLANKKTLWGLGLIAAFLLILGCINCINLSTAQAIQRIKEIGVRKTLGSSRKQLMMQFLIEALLLTAIAAILALILTPALLYAFADFIPPELKFNLAGQPHILFFLAGLILMVGFLSGFYPALYLSRLQPASILKSTGFTKNAKAPLRKILTVSQFFIAQVFIMATLMVCKQIQYLLTKDMGFKKDAIITLSLPKNIEHKNELFAEKLKAIPQIEKISIGRQSPSAGGVMSRGLDFFRGNNKIHTQVHFKFGDRNFLPIYHLRLLAGRNLLTDTAREFIINETYLKILGFKTPQQAIGHFITDDKPVPIVGVIADFNQNSLRSPIEPLILTSKTSSSNILHIALDQQRSNWPNTIAKMENVWKKIYPEDDFKYRFIDENIANFYKAEQNISKLLRWATGLAILISCMGLFGLAIYTINQRTKEIGVRKVLGASVQQISMLLLSDFMRLVFFAFIIAVPVAGILLHKWLETFAYKIELSWIVFFLAGVLMMAVALITISIQTIRAARENPVKNLRVE